MTPSLPFPHPPSHPHSPLPLTSSPSLALQYRWSSPHWRQPCLTWTSKRALQSLSHLSESDRTAFKLSSFLTPSLSLAPTPTSTCFYVHSTSCDKYDAVAFSACSNILSLVTTHLLTLPFFGFHSLPFLTRFLTPPPHRGQDVVYTYMILLYVRACMPACVCTHSMEVSHNISLPCYVPYTVLCLLSPRRISSGWMDDSLAGQHRAEWPTDHPTHITPSGYR